MQNVSSGFDMRGSGKLEPSAAPVAIIRPGGVWAALDLRELWVYRELLYFMTWRDLKVRYKQAALGIAWVVMQPLLSALIFTVFLGKLARVPSNGVPYALFSFTGILLWTFFSTAVLGSSTALVSSSHLITKVYFPRMIIPTASVCARLIDSLVSLIILLGLMVYYRIAPTPGLLMVPLIILLTALLALGLGMLTSAMNVKYRDVGVILPVLIQLLMFLSPIVYPSTLLPAHWQTVYKLNPIVGLVENFRAALFGSAFDWTSLGLSIALTIVLLIYSAYQFRRMERFFADII